MKRNVHKCTLRESRSRDKEMRQRNKFYRKNPAWRDFLSIISENIGYLIFRQMSTVYWAARSAVAPEVKSYVQIW